MAAPLPPTSDRPAGILPENFLAQPPSIDTIALAMDRVIGNEPAPAPAAMPLGAYQAQPTATFQPQAGQPVPHLRLVPEAPAAPAPASLFTDPSYPDPTIAFAPPAPQPEALPAQPHMAPQHAAPPAPAPAGTPGAVPGAPPMAADGGISTLGELAQMFGVHEQQLTDSVHITTADGHAVPLSTAIRGYLSQPNAEQIIQERAQGEVELEQERGRLQGIHDEAILRVGHLAKALHEVGIGTSQAELTHLQVQDPLAYDRERVRIMERQTAIDGAMRNLDAEAQRVMADRDREHTAWVQRETDKRMKIFPDLANPATRAQQELAIKSYLGGIGFNGQEQEGLQDARHYSVIRDALYGSEVRKLATQRIASAKQRGLPAPAAAPSSRPETPGIHQQHEAELTRLVTSHRERGTVDSAAAVFKQMGFDQL